MFTIESLQSLSDEELISLRTVLDDSYYNSHIELVPDHKYDVFFEYLISRIPSQRFKIGSKLREHSNKTRLPYWMGSLDKKKDDKSISRWTDKYRGPYFITEKLDGISSLLVYDKLGNISMYTRGDGSYGSDITYLSKYLSLPKAKDISVRGELIVKIKNFSKYSDTFDNARQMVSGIVNAKTLKQGIEVIDFVSYQIIRPIRISDQYKILEKLGFATPRYSAGFGNINEKVLKTTLLEYKSLSDYNIDGLVVIDDNEHIPNTSDNPDHAFAFKMMGEIFKTEVEDVTWEISKSCILKPTVKVKPVNVGDVVISYATGFNAKYIVDNGIGEGAVVNITRSGDVIPYIVSVLKKTTPKLPDVKYSWNESRVDIFGNLQDISDEFCVKYLSEFISGIGILNIGESTVKKMYSHGYTSFDKIIECNENSFQHIEGLGVKSSKNIYNSIQTGLSSLTLTKLVGVSNVLGQGISEKKVSAILNTYPDIFTEEKDRPIDEYKTMINSIFGFSDITANRVAVNIPWAKKLCLKYRKYITKETVVSKDKNIRVVFSGFRDKNLEDRLKKEGYEIMTSVSKKVNYVVVKDLKENTGKVQKAKDLDIQIIKLENFLDIIK
jgi:DNA ligase (NAD+)